MVKKTDTYLDFGYLTYLSTSMYKHEVPEGVPDPTSSEFYLQNVPKHKIKRKRVKVKPTVLDRVASDVAAHILAISDVTGLDRSYILNNFMSAQTHVHSEAVSRHIKARIEESMDTLVDILEEYGRVKV